MSKTHAWTFPQIRWVAALWAENWSAPRIAEAFSKHYGVSITTSSIVTLASRNRALMPIKNDESVRRAISEGVRRQSLEEQRKTADAFAAILREQFPDLADLIREAA